MLFRLQYIVLFLLCIATTAYPMDRIQLVPEFSPSNYQYAYEYSLLKRALQVTENSDGPFVITHDKRNMSRKRILCEMAEQDSINVHVAATRIKWEKEAIPIRIPIFKGLLGYRLFLINKNTTQQFEQIRNLCQLQKMRAGSGSQWTTTSVLMGNGFHVITSMDYYKLLKLLDSGRLDYFPRGVNEIYHELEMNKTAYPNLQIERTLALYFPTPCYFFVSPKYPRLADRLKRGMEQLVETGELKAMINAEFGDDIARAKLNERHIFTIQNRLLPDKTPYHRKELWFTPQQ